jgi:hypothetical protein
MGLRAKVISVVIVVIAASFGIGIGSAVANTTTTSGIPYTCATRLGNQVGSYGAAITDTIDPAAVGDSVTYTFVAPFSQAAPPIAATYQGGTVTYPIPTGLAVTSVSTPPKAGSNLSSTVAVVGTNIVVTTTGNQPIDGNSHPAPDLIVKGTILAAAAGPGVIWRTPSQLVANVHTDLVGDIVATCTPDVPTSVIATTTVPGAAKPPVAGGQSLAVAQGRTKAITLTATDGDTPQNQLTFAITTPPAHGTLTGTAPNVSYKSAADFTGTDTFQFSATDPGGLTSTATVTIRVYPANVIDNTPPVILLLAPANGAVYTPGQVVNAAFACGDATTEIASCVGTTANGAPISTTLGQHTFTVTTADAQGNKAQKTVSYRVIDTARVHQAYNATETIPLACTSTTGASSGSIPAVVSAPSQVGTGRTLTMRFAPGAQSSPILTTTTNIVYTLDVPINGTAQSAALVSGTGTANAAATVAVSNGRVILTIAGPIAGGTTAATSYTPPAIDVTILASGAPTSQVQTRLAGYKLTTAPNSLPQVAMTKTCTAGTDAAGTANPVLTKTTIVDTTPPTISLDQPSNALLFRVGDVLNSQYACADEASLSSCTGTNATATPIDTGTPGKKTFLVTATDAGGNVAQSLTSYTVVQATFTANFTTSEASLLDSAASYFHTDRAGLIRQGVAVIGYYVSVNGPPSGPPGTPPSNTGPISVSTSYSAADAQTVAALGQLYGLTGDQLHKYAAILLIYVWSVQAR